MQSKKKRFSEKNGYQVLNLDSVQYHGVKIAEKRPDNVVQLHDNTNVIIREIFARVQNEINIKRPDDVFFEGYPTQTRDDVFTTPCTSTAVGIARIRLSNEKKTVHICQY